MLMRSTLLLEKNPYINVYVSFVVIEYCHVLIIINHFSPYITFVKITESSKFKFKIQYTKNMHKLMLTVVQDVCNI